MNINNLSAKAQIIIAAKALIEQGVALNVVANHAWAQEVKPL